MSINLFILVIIITGLIGVRRGWAREVITTAILLTTVAFLTLGGAAFLIQLFSHGFVGTASAHPLSGGGPSVSPGSSGGTTSQTQDQAACITTSAQSLSTFIFFGMTWLAYWAGWKHGQPPKNGTHHLAGIVPGVINGAVIMYYVNYSVLMGRQLTVESPSPASMSAALPLIFGLGLLGLLAVLFVSRQGKASS